MNEIIAGWGRGYAGQRSSFDFCRRWKAFLRKAYARKIADAGPGDGDQRTAGDSHPGSLTGFVAVSAVFGWTADLQGRQSFVFSEFENSVYGFDTHPSKMVIWFSSDT